jgi:hypothetical protein
MARKVKGFDVQVGRLSHWVTHVEMAIKKAVGRRDVAREEPRAAPTSRRSADPHDRHPSRPNSFC